MAMPHMAELLTEVFTGGPEIALQVKEIQVEKIFQLISSGHEAQVQLIETLQAIAKVCKMCSIWMIAIGVIMYTEVIWLCVSKWVKINVWLDIDVSQSL